MSAKKLLVASLLTILIGSAWWSAARAEEPDAARVPAPTPSQAETLWDYHTVDTGSTLGPHSTIGLDAAGGIHVVYCDRSAQRLRHSWRSGTTWYLPQTLPITDVGCDNYDAAVDLAGRLHVAYQSSTGSAFKYAYQNASGWHVESVDGETTVDGISLALDDSGYPHVAYRSATVDGQLMYTHKDASGWWNPEVVDSTPGAGWYSSLVVDAGGRGNISYTRLSDTQLWYARRQTSGWVRWPVDPDVGLDRVYSSLALTSGGYPHICYYGLVDTPFPDQPAFQYVYRDGDGWQGPFIVDDTISSASDWECSLAIDGSDFVHMTYHRNGWLMHYYQDAQGWWSEPVATYDGEYHVGRFNSVAAAYGGQPFISYDDETDGGKIMVASGEARAPALIGNTACAWGDEDCNRCAAGLVKTFNRLYPRGDIFGFRLGDFPDPNWQIHNHWQGITRVATGTGQYLIVTQDEVSDGAGNDRAAFAVVRMGSRNPDGERFRSNRLDPFEHVLSTAPPAQDVVTHAEFIPSAPDHIHPGSAQALGDLMAVGVDREVHLYNLVTPESPYYLGQILDREGKTGSSTAMAQLQDGRYLLVVAGSEAAVLDFYVSYLPHSYAGFWHVYEWSKDDVHWDDQAFDWGWNSFQSLSLVTDCASGKLYLLGTGNFGQDWIPVADPWGPDWAGLYELGYEPGTAKISVTKVADRHLNCSLDPMVHYSHDPGADPADNCNLDAAGGAYVDPYGVLFLYATEHDNLGPEGSVKAMEFRPQPHHTCTTIEDAWVELFEHDHFRGVNMMIDYVDTAEYSGHDPAYYEDHKRYNEFMDRASDVVGLDEKASSVKWCLPPGWAYRLYKRSIGGISCGDKFLSLYGTGKPLQIPDLKDWHFGDQASCSFYSQDPPVVAQVLPGTGQRLIYAAYLHEASSAAALLAAPDTEEPPPDADMVTIVDVPAGAVAEQVTLTYVPTTTVEAPDPPRTLAQRTFVLAVKAGGVPQPDYAFAQPVEVTIRYHDGEVVGVDEGSLSLYWWDGDGGAWANATGTCNAPGPTIRDAEKNTLSLSICRAGLFALMGTAAPSRVLYDEAHNSQKTIDWQRALELSATLPWNPDPLWVYYGELVDRLSGEFVLERNASAPLTPALLAPYDALILDTYQAPLAPDEVLAVQRYVAEGGGLVLLGECGRIDPSPELPASFGMTFEAPCLFAPGAGLDGTVVVTDVVGHAASGEVLEYAQNWGTSLSLSADALPIADTLGGDVWQDANGNDQYDAGEEGVFDVMAVLDSGCGRVAALPDGTFADADLEWTDNDALLRALLRWVTQGQPCDAGFGIYLPLVLRR